jgi:hypothetical protein
MANDYNLLTVHRDPARHQFFSTAIHLPPYFDSSNDMWIVTRPEDCRDLIASDRLKPDTYAVHYALLRKRFGFDFPGLSFAFEHLPICLDGEPHEIARRKVAELLSSARGQLRSSLPAMIARHFIPFDRPGIFDLMDDVVNPFVNELSGSIAGVPLESFCDAASQIFDRLLGMKKRRLLEAQISHLRQHIETCLGKTATPQDIGARLALITLATDSLKGTIGDSLREILQSASGQRLEEINFPEHPTQTGVPVIERIVARPFSRTGIEFKRDDRVRIYLQSFAYGPASARSNFFGAGAHACLGRPISVELWLGIRTFLSNIRLRARLLSYGGYRATDYVFAIPQNALIEVSP